MASKLKSVNVGGACFLDTLSRALRRSNAEEIIVEVVAAVILDEDLFEAAPDLLYAAVAAVVAMLSLFPRMLANGLLLHPLLKPIDDDFGGGGWWYGFCCCSCCGRVVVVAEADDDDALCLAAAAKDRLPRLAVARSASAAR